MTAPDRWPGGAARFRRPYPAPWFDRPAEALARALLGSDLVRRDPSGGYRAARIVETEAYGRDDPASHAFAGPTERNRSMFGAPGTLYVYAIHQVVCANVVAERGTAVLLRGARPLAGLAGRTDGPGRLARSMGLTRSDDGRDLTRSRIRILPGEAPIGPIAIGPRVGVRRAADRPLRYAIVGDPYVSRPRPPDGAARPVT